MIRHMPRRVVSLYLFLIAILSTSYVQAQQRKSNYQVAAIAFYNFENFYDTVDDPKVLDEDFTPGGIYHYTTAVYRAKVHNLATVLKALGTEVTQDGAVLIGGVEIESESVIR